MDYSKIEKTVKNRDKLINRLIKDMMVSDQKEYISDHVEFVVARKWNSWYPSFFSTLGGCYAIIPLNNSRTIEKKEKGIIVIDPGFDFLDVLKKYHGIAPYQIKKIIVTHFHPDHMGGLIEFLAMINAFKFNCALYLNTTSFEFFKSFSSKYLHVHEIKPGQLLNLCEYTYDTNESDDLVHEAIYLKVKSTHHEEVGLRHNTVGLQVLFERDGIIYHNIGLIGDTDGSDFYMPEYLKDFADSDIVVLHVGSFYDTDNFGKGDKHLYANGTKTIIKKMISNNNFKYLKLIILSEFGLEHAEINELKELVRPVYLSERVLLKLVNIIGLFEKEGSISDDEKLLYSLLCFDEIKEFIENKDKLSDKTVLVHISVLSALAVLLTKVSFFHIIGHGMDINHNDLNEKLNFNALKSTSLNSNDKTNIDVNYRTHLKSGIRSILQNLQIINNNNLDVFLEYSQIMTDECKKLLTMEKQSKYISKLMPMEFKITLSDCERFGYLSTNEVKSMSELTYEEFFNLALVFAKSLHEMSSEQKSKQPTKNIEIDSENTLMLSINNIFQDKIKHAGSDVKILIGSFNLKVSLNEKELKIQDKSENYQNYSDVVLKILNGDIYYNKP